MNDKALDFLEEKYIKIRGSIIAGTIEIERLIDQYLSYYFCETFSKSVELREMLLSSDRLALSPKIEILLTILKNKNPVFISKYPNFSTKLLDIMTHRNIFAHAEIMTNDISSEEVTFLRYKSGKVQHKKYTQETILSIEKDIVFVSLKLLSLINGCKIMN